MEPSFVIAAGGQRLLIIGQGDIGKLFDVLHLEGIGKNLISLTFIAQPVLADHILEKLSFAFFRCQT